MTEKISELQMKAGPQCLGRDRAYRRYWVVEAIPGLFVEHDDDLVGTCLPTPTVLNPNSKPIDENTAIEKAKQILDAREKSSENQGSDKENDQEDSQKKTDPKTYSKNKNNVQKVLSTKNGTVSTANPETASTSDDIQVLGEVRNGEIKNEIKNEIKEEQLVTEVKKEQLVNGTSEHIKSEVDEVKPETNKMWGVCLADMDNCTVHSTILPKTHWSYVGTIEELDEIIDALNPRGFREGDLKEKLKNERNNINKNLKRFTDIESKIKIKDEDEKKPMEVENNSKDIHTIVDLAIRDQILELEERIFFGTLGTLKIRDRPSWQKAIQEGSYDMQCEGLSWGGKSILSTPFESRMVSASASRAPSRPGSPDSNQRDSGGSFVKRQNDKVKGLASAILQVAQMVEAKYFKSPLGE